MIAAERPQVVVVDPRLPELAGGRAFIARIRELDPALGVVVMCWPEALEDALLADAADACIRKTFRAGELVAAVEAVASTRAA
jgi:DNA-binding response OmpR family regulator